MKNLCKNLVLGSLMVLVSGMADATLRTYDLNVDYGERAKPIVLSPSRVEQIENMSTENIELYTQLVGLNMSHDLRSDGRLIIIYEKTNEKIHVCAPNCVANVFYEWVRTKATDSDISNLKEVLGITTKSNFFRKDKDKEDIINCLKEMFEKNGLLYSIATQQEDRRNEVNGLFRFFGYSDAKRQAVYQALGDLNRPLDSKMPEIVTLIDNIKIHQAMDRFLNFLKGDQRSAVQLVCSSKSKQDFKAQVTKYCPGEDVNALFDIYTKLLFFAQTKGRNVLEAVKNSDNSEIISSTLTPLTWSDGTLVTEAEQARLIELSRSL